MRDLWYNELRKIVKEEDEVSAVEDYREAREGSFYKVTALTITKKADAAIAELEAELQTAEEENERLKVCGPHCPACVEFTTVFTMPKVEYLGCLRKQSESTKLMNKTAAPIGQPCPYASTGETP